MATVLNNVEMEKSLLSTMTLADYAIEKASETLTAQSFSDQKNSILFTTICHLHETNQPINISSIVLELESKDLLTRIGGLDYLQEVVEKEPVAANCEYFAEKVREAAVCRNLISTCKEIETAVLENNNESINDLLDASEKKILDVAKNRKTEEFKRINQVMDSAVNNLYELYSNKSDVSGIPSGWSDLDSVTAGFRPGQLVIVGARPAMGKTVFGLNIAVHAAMHSHKTVAVFNLEMTAEQLVNRIFSQVGQIEGWKFNNGKFNNDDWDRINEARAQLGDAKLLISDSSTSTINEIKSKCRRQAATDEGLDLVVIDYLQLITVAGKNYGTNRQQEISDISRALKLLALELKVPVIALCQLSRGVEAREDKRPLMSDLRESGSIEQDADNVMFIYRDAYYKRTNKADEVPESDAEIIIAKNRSGRTATINLVFKGDRCCFLSKVKDE